MIPLTFLMSPAFLSIFSTLNDLGFVVKILVFSYVLYWLFIVFREQQILLGIGTIIAAYFMFFHSVSLIVLVLLFFVFIVMSGHFQFLIDMGFVPILEMLGFKMGAHGPAEEQAKLQEINQKLYEGKQLTPEELKMFKESQEKEQKYQQRAQELLYGQYVHGAMR